MHPRTEGTDRRRPPRRARGARPPTKPFQPEPGGQPAELAELQWVSATFILLAAAGFILSLFPTTALLAPRGACLALLVAGIGAYRLRTTLKTYGWAIDCILAAIMLYAVARWAWTHRGTLDQRGGERGPGGVGGVHSPDLEAASAAADHARMSGQVDRPARQP